IDARVRALGNVIGSFIAVAGIVLLPAGTASAAPFHGAAVSAQPPPGDSDRRLANGQFVRSGSRTGKGELTIDNGGGHDAVITMAMNGNPVYSVYVRNGATYTVRGIRDSTYEIFFTTGTDWDSQNRDFTRERALQRFDQTFPFTTTRTATELRWTTGKITLNPVVGGNASTSSVDPKDYPAV
ncbi:MAG: hypothetical protein ACRDSH_00040, partial [Pseudonocardiaceae bacterium]